MIKQTTFVVGDGFARLADLHSQVFTKSQFELMLESTRLDGHCVFIGQGVSLEQRRELNSRIRNAGGQPIDGGMSWTPASKELTGQHQAYNQLISMPLRTGESSFEFDLLIDDRSAGTSDHNHSHVNGQTLAEAARQGLSAVARRYILPHSDFALLYDFLEMRFNRFLFWLPIRMRMTVTQSVHVRNDWPLLTASVSFHQSSEAPNATATLAFTAAPRFEIDNIEAKLGCRAVDATIHALESERFRQGAD
ncbi:MAG: AfsA-related hotdog domain-containing protein [Phycisphaerales bacterium]